MSDNRKVAQGLMNTAAKMVDPTVRGSQHGSTEGSFELIGNLWTSWLRHARRVRGHDAVSGSDVAQMMSMLKKARSMYGDPTNDDNFVDDIGYTGLAGMLQLPDPEATDESGASDRYIEKPVGGRDIDKGDANDKWITDDLTSSLEKEFGRKIPAVPLARHTGINTPKGNPNAE